MRCSAPGRAASFRAPVLVALCAGLIATAVSATPAGAEPPDPVGHEPPPPPLPAVALQGSDWEPKFPFPYDRSRQYVTDADITAEREMCQWYTQQYDELMQQIDRFNIKLITRNGDWSVDDVPEHAGAVAANIDRSVDFLAPRAQALTQQKDYVGDNYFPLYQGESFYLLWQHLSNVGRGIKARQPAWFTGPSMRRVQYWGSRIHRSHVCR
ncbi:hypothetical protein H7J77_13380 [Mycolicibacillus parakoreensis]|uniref:Uncharacterized protein n=1 Tax=Mycolicibacillus parakoreensis TaxID=1069221 RepID=A0ABY3U2F0_9MYCO|nr:hypothetical protein [Mycolicibacillus parakoreensis]MCV7316530.1 hypothetical protein [Mycolicibacillus parakoreensis]ULN52755.1 hypothetical protein MIU77_18365 [Mycolicibacillus parakoreensis]HLR98353.1 hypothetical protein [Mycolicibacillus parakoreensis]